jgi:hypothetical protein
MNFAFFDAAYTLKSFHEHQARNKYLLRAGSRMYKYYIAQATHDDNG